MIKGSCLCGKINYEADVLVGPIVFCHCHFCRKASSTAFSSNSVVGKEAFEVTKGQDWLTSYESSAGKLRYYCKNCHTQLFHTVDGRDLVTIKLGTIDELDQDIDKLEKYHINCQSDKAWLNYEGLKKYPLSKDD